MTISTTPTQHHNPIELFTTTCAFENGKLDLALAEGVAEMPRYPQVLVNVRVEHKIDVKTSEPVQVAVAAAEARLAGRGRVVLRPSGTEPLIRVMVEGENEAQVRREADGLAEVVRAASSAPPAAH